MNQRHFLPVVLALGFFATASFSISVEESLAQIAPPEAAADANTPEEDDEVDRALLALVIAPIATELPEKFNSVIWIRGGKDTLAMGNITGAMVFQSAIPTVVALVGDGSAMYSITALWSAANQKLPVIFVIANNAGYQILKNRLKLFHGNDTPIGMDFNDPPMNVTKVAEGFGVFLVVDVAQALEEQQREDEALVLAGVDRAAQQRGSVGGQTAEDDVGGVDDVPDPCLITSHFLIFLFAITAIV